MFHDRLSPEPLLPPGLRIGIALCGSFCTFDTVLREIDSLVKQGGDVTPILSFNVASTDTRFGTAATLAERLEDMTGHPPWCTLCAVEPIGPAGLLDILAVAPCTGTTLARLAAGLSDTPVTLAVKSHLRALRPVVLAVSTNDALGTSMRNIAQLMNTKRIYFVPLRQDDPRGKPASLVARFEMLPATIAAALKGEQLQPVFGSCP